MRYGVREICDVVFKAKANTTIGGIRYEKGDPVLFIDSAKTSTLEGAGTTVYATGGRGNTRLLTWEGEKTLTFTVEDALLSPISFAMLTGAGLLKAEETTGVKVHKTEKVSLSGDGKFTLSFVPATDCPIYAIELDEHSEFKAVKPEKITLTEENLTDRTVTVAKFANKNLFIDYYTIKKANVSELQIDAEHFGGYYYVEASTLFKRQSDGFDAPVEITIPKVKIQSNFTFAMAATGDPSTFTFTMDAMPDYTFFNPNKKVLCAMQIVEDTSDEIDVLKSVFEGKHTYGTATTLTAPTVTVSAVGAVTLSNNDDFTTYNYEVINEYNAVDGVGYGVTDTVLQAVVVSEGDKIRVQGIAADGRMSAYSDPVGRTA